MDLLKSSINLSRSLTQSGAKEEFQKALTMSQLLSSMGEEEAKKLRSSAGPLSTSSGVVSTKTHQEYEQLRIERDQQQQRQAERLAELAALSESKSQTEQREAEQRQLVLTLRQQKTALETREERLREDVARLSGELQSRRAAEEAQRTELDLLRRFKAEKEREERDQLQEIEWLKAEREDRERSQQTTQQRLHQLLQEAEEFKSTEVELKARIRRMQIEKEQLELQEQQCETEIEVLCIEKGVKKPELPGRGMVRTGKVVHEHAAFEYARKGEHNRLEAELAVISPDITNSEGNTLLMVAAQHNKKEVIKCMLKRKVHLNAQNLKGYTALHFAMQHGHTDLARCAVCACLCARRCPGLRTCMCVVERDGTYQCAFLGVRYLALRGADPSVKNIYGQTPYQGLSTDVRMLPFSPEVV